MRRNSYTLAALAASAVPGLEPARTTPVATPIDEFDVAGVIGTDGRRLLVTAPGSAAAGAHLEKDVHVADALAGTSLAPLVTRAVGFALLAEGGRAVVTDTPRGVPVMFGVLEESVALARSLGRTIARIHAVPTYVAESAGVESFSASTLRDALRARVERVRTESGLPSSVSQRWTTVLADDDLWAVHPCFIHGALSEETLFCEDDEITGVIGWFEASTADPATDLAWLVSTLHPELVDELYAAYTRALPVTPHPRTLERAQVLGEFAVADWLLHGLDTEDETVIEDARGMLEDLDHDLAQLARDEAEQRYDDLAADARPGARDDVVEVDRTVIEVEVHEVHEEDEELPDGEDAAFQVETPPFHPADGTPGVGSPSNPTVDAADDDGPATAGREAGTDPRSATDTTPDAASPDGAPRRS